MTKKFCYRIRAQDRATSLGKLSMRNIQKLMFWGLLASAFIPACIAGQSEVFSPPICPTKGLAPYPQYAELGKPPNVAIWREIWRGSAQYCKDLNLEPADLVVALAGRFRHAGSIQDLAARVGAVSMMKGLRYWSTTEQRWRDLISEAIALERPESASRRPDFTANEVLSGQPLYFAQNDTRSTGLNVYRIDAKSDRRRQLSLRVINVDPIRLTVVTLFEPQTLQSLHFFEHVDNDVWTYYGISIVKGGAAQGQEKSLINRNAALYRFLIGEPSDKEPPLAR